MITSTKTMGRAKCHDLLVEADAAVPDQRPRRGARSQTLPDARSSNVIRTLSNAIVRRGSPPWEACRPSPDRSEPATSTREPGRNSPWIRFHKFKSGRAPLPL